MANKILKELEIDGMPFDMPFNYLGKNPTGSVANDTYDFWYNKGTGYATISSINQLINQPTTGILLSFVEKGIQLLIGERTIYTRITGGAFIMDWHTIPNIETVKSLISTKVPSTTSFSETGTSTAHSPGMNSWYSDSVYTVTTEGLLIGRVIATWPANATGIRHTSLRYNATPGQASSISGNSLGGFQVGATPTGNMQQSFPFITYFDSDTIGKKLYTTFMHTASTLLTPVATVTGVLFPKDI